MRFVKKILLYFFLTLVVLIIAIGSSVFLFQDKIIQQFIREANKNINTPVQYGHIDISAWRDFPNVALTFTDVYVEDSQPEKYPLLTAKSIAFYINSLDVWRGNYSIRGLHIDGAEVNLKFDKNEKNNFTILKKSEVKEKSKTISFDLQDVTLTNTKFSYQNLHALQQHQLASDKLIASIHVRGAVYKIEMNGDITVGQIGMEDAVFLKNKKFTIATHINYDDSTKTIVVEESKLNIEKSQFTFAGRGEFKNKTGIDLQVKGNNTDVQTLLSLFPESITAKLKDYQSHGEIYFSLSLKGELSKTRSPFLSVRFGCKNASFFHPQFKSKIEKANLEGSFATASLTDFSSAEIFLQKISGTLNGKPFQSKFSMRNFSDPTVSLDFKGNVDALWIQNFYPDSKLKNVSGETEADFHFAGKTSWLKKKSTAQKVRAEGSLELKDISFATADEKIQLRKLNGILQFNKNDVAMSNVSGQLLDSDFTLNGFFKNVFTFLLFNNQPIGIEADLKSDFLNVEQLMTLGGQADATTVGFSISPNVQLNFNCAVNRLKYKRFFAEKIKGDLLVKNQMAVSRNLSLRAMDGTMRVNGIVDAKNPKATAVSAAFKLDGVRLDSLFFVFNNFNQEFVTVKNLKGKIFADINMELSLNEKLKLFPETLVADISAQIKNGELNNFEPLQKLNRYLDDKALSQLRFADLKNDIHIENKTIFIPQMEIRTNATTINVSGTHTFDQHIDYHIVAPLNNKKKIDADETFGAVEEVGGRTKIFLKIVGTTAHYEIKLDKTATKKKITSDLKKEVKELKDAFKNRGVKKKEDELQKDDYFDWDGK